MKTDLDKFLTQMEKDHGKGSVITGDSAEILAKSIERWQLDSPILSYILGGGLPKGRIVETFGNESAGKTSISTFILGCVQKQLNENERVAVVDAENSYDLEYAKTLGLDVDKTLFSQPGSGEDSLQIAEEMIESGIVKCMIIDSVSALVPQAEIDGDMGDQQMGLQARLMSKACRKLSSLLAKQKASIIFINQLRSKIGVMFGSNETTSGGRALRFWSSIRLDVRRAEFITENDEPIGLKSRIKSVKNKTFAPYKKGEIEIIFGEGVQFEGEYLDFAVQNKVIDKSASWYIIDNERIQGRARVIDYLKNNPVKYEEIKEKVDQSLGFIKDTNKREDVKKRQSKSDSKKGDSENEKQK